MPSLREKLLDTSDFLVGVELVSIRGSMAESRTVKARDLAVQLVDSPLIDWISVTDNAGGNPQLAPQALGKPILYAGNGSEHQELSVVKAQSEGGWPTKGP